MGKGGILKSAQISQNPNHKTEAAKTHYAGVREEPKKG